jgi:hypothetical protein
MGGVTNRVYKVLVTTGGAAAANIAAVTAGKYAVTKKDGTVYTAGDTIAASDTFQVVVGDQNGSPVFSDPIQVKDITSYAKQVYRAKVEQVVTVTVGTPVAGIEYTLRVNDRSDKEILPMRQSIRAYTVLAVAGDTATTVATAFYNKIVADPASIVVATNPSAGVVVLTAKAVANTANQVGEYYDQYFFDVTLAAVDNYGYFQTWGTIVKTTAPDFGSGNFYQVRTLEQYGLGYTGITNRMGFPVDIPNYLSVSGTNYDVYVIENSNTHQTGLETLGAVKAPITTIIAVTAGAGTAIEAILTPLIQSAPTESLGAQI